MKIMLALCIALFSALGCAQVGGTASIGGIAYLGQPSGLPAISNVITASTTTTIVASFKTNSFASPGLACGTSAGSYTIAAKDNGVDVDSPVNHLQVVVGLSPSTTYYCQYSATNTAGSTNGTFSIATTAISASTPITGLSLGTPTLYNSLSANNQGSGDTFYNCKSDDGSVYMTSDDNLGFKINSAPTDANGSQQSLMKVVSESPLVIQTFQQFASYGFFSQGPNPDGLSAKNTGLFCMDRKLFLAIGRQNQDQSNGIVANPTGGALTQLYGNIIWSGDHGANWNNPQNNSNFITAPTSPLSYSMFPGSPSTMATAEFVHYCADDGTLGYLVACNQHDQGDAYVYLVANEGTWNGGGTAGGGNVFYLARVLRAKLQNLNGVDYQWYVSGDGTQDTSWTSTEANAQPILSNSGQLGEPNIQYIPALNRYLMLTFYYPSGVIGAGGNKLDSFWLGYEAPYPWGPWTKIYSQEFSGPDGGWYNPIILNDTIYSGTTPTVLWTNNYANGSDYTMFFATMTIQH